MANKHFQFLRSSTEYTSFDLAKNALSGKKLNPGEPALAYYAEDGKKKALLAIGGQKNGQIYFYNSDKIEELIAAAEARVNATIEGLDIDAVGGNGKVITTISQTDGKVSATATDLNAANVAYASDSSDTHISASTTVEQALRALDEALVESTEAQKSYKIVPATVADTNVKEAYKIQVSNNGSAYSDVDSSSIIKIYKDSALIEVYLGSSADTIDKQTGKITKTTTEDAQSLNFKYQLADGTYSLTKIDVTKFLTQSEFKNGLQVSDTGEVSVKIDATSDDFLTVGAGGLKLSGVTSAIDTSLKSAKTYTNNAIANLDATVSDTSNYSTVKIYEVDGKLTDVTITDTIGNVSENTAGYAEATDVKAYVDATVAAKNVTAKGDDYVSATTEGNKVTVSTNVSGLTINKSDNVDSTLVGTANTLVDGSELATKVSSFVDTRIKEEIKKLNVDDAAGTDEFVTSVSETDGKISVTRGKVAASSVTAVEIEAVASEKVAVTGTNVAAQIESLAKSVAVAQEACNIDSKNEAIVVTDGAGKENHTKIEFKLSASGATSDMLTIVSDGLKMSDTWDCGTFN